MMDKAPLNILMMDRYLTIGGVATYLKTLSKALINKGHTVYLITAADEDNRRIRDTFDSYGVRIITVPESKNKIGIAYRFIKRTTRFVKDHNIDVIHTHHRIVNFAGMAISKLCNVPHLLTLHVIKNDYPLLTRLWRNEQVTVPSGALKNNLVHHYGLDESHIQVIANAIATEYQVDAKKQQVLKQQMFADDGKFYIGYIGRISYEKGVDVLLESIPLVKEKCAGAEFRIFGDGEELPKLKERCLELGLNPDDIFRGTNYDVNELLGLMDLCAIPSRSESFCLFALESMRASKPVIATKVGGIPEVVIDGKTGLLIHSENPGQLAESILKLYEDKMLREQLAQKGHKRFIEEFSSGNFFDDYLAKYNALIKEVEN